MASSNETLVDTLLADLGFPKSLLEVFEQSGIGVFELLTITVEQLQTYLEPTETAWKYDDLFNNIAIWRQRNKHKILRALNAPEIENADQPCADNDQVPEDSIAFID
ncbi:uncharacterized protein LOC131427624 [Malaya genurostris]|uniref:uncharacterized protein LOC131427624 n=1 Tax=Malaya genurostris TaxID=325434 RepID=UPI0026F3CBC8|nr:uncharacterized protein LOC131427624 [Malaya genurostris]